MMRFSSKIYTILLIVTGLLFLDGCATNDNPYKGMSEGQIFQSGQTALKESDYVKAVASFEAQEAQYPYGPYAHQEQLNIIYAYYQDGDFPSAQAAAQRYIHLNPEGRYVDYAYYMKAMSMYARDRSFLENYFPVDPALRDMSLDMAAFDAFNYLLKTYPESPYASDARLHMVYIRNALARNNLAAAKYYISRKAYIAALNRVRTVVFKFQGSPLMSQALEMMLQCYQELKLDKDAQATLNIIKLNYPALYQRLTS